MGCGFKRSFCKQIYPVNNVRKMVSFVLGKEVEKDACCIVTSVGRQRKHSESPREIEHHAFGFIPVVQINYSLCVYRVKFPH